MKNIFLPATVCILLAALVSCTKDKATQPTNTNPTQTTTQTFVPTGLHTDGFGNSKKALTGTPYVLPAGISINGIVKTNMSSCSSGSYYECVTDGDLPYYMTLVNSNAHSTTVIFPAGIVIPSLDTLYQGGVIVQDDTVVVPASSSVCVNLNAHCINRNRTFSSDVPCGSLLITDNDNLTPLITLLSHKHAVSYDRDQALQNAIWHVADSARLTQQDIDAINQLP